MWFFNKGSHREINMSKPAYPVYPCHTIMTHWWTHLDEYLARRILILWGREVFPGIENAKMDWVDAGSTAPEHILANRAQYPALIAGCVPLGVWGRRMGPFDEHSDDEQGSANDSDGRRECAASLVYRFLKLDNPRLEKLVEYVRKVDTEGGDHPEGIGETVKLLNSMFPNSPLAVMDWVTVGLEAWLNSDEEEINGLEINFIAGLVDESRRADWLKLAQAALQWKKDDYQKAIAFIKKRGNEKEITTRGGHKIKILILVTDLPRASFAGTGYKRADVVIVKRPSSGQVGIFTRHASNIKLDDVAAVINLMEQQKAGEVHTTDWSALRREGKISGGRWHKPSGMDILLNGGNSAPDAPATELSMTEILTALQIALEGTFYQKNGIACDGKICVSSPLKSCPWYKFGLYRCRQVRARKYRASNNRQGPKHRAKRQQQKQQPVPVTHTPFADLANKMAAK
jgi:hypothetical protein